VTRILVLAGSNRAGSPDRRLAGEAVRLLATSHAVEVARLDLVDYPLPIFDGEGDGASGLPENAVKLAGQFAASDAALVSTPEYNAAPAPLLVSALAWAGRVRRLGNRPVLPFRGLVVGLAAAAPDRSGGTQALAQLRGLFAALGAEVIARQCAVASAGEAFEADGRLARAHDRDALEKLVESLADVAAALRRTG
jgi:chromate reductase, NAD(P)H dehydrogenase (quinone)